MIVNDDTVSKALQYLAEDPHPIALARKDLTDAETNTKTVYSRLLLVSKQNSVAAKEADALQDPDYLQAKDAENGALLELERHKARTKAAEMICEIWRSEQANVRAAERVR